MDKENRTDKDARPETGEARGTQPKKQRAIVPVQVGERVEYYNVVATCADDARCRAGDMAARETPGADVRAGHAGDIVWTGDVS